MQGFNMGRYYGAPDDSRTSSGPQFNTLSHPLGSRARARKPGVLTVRFEMPFAVWCSTCPRPTLIGQGVRFNAEKKKVGMYHSTAVWEFRMKHAECGGVVVVRTDPAATEYVVTEGGKRRDYGEERRPELLEGEEGKREDAMAGLEGKREEGKLKRDGAKRVEELQDHSERLWADPYAANKRLRKEFRKERKVRHADEERGEKLAERAGLELEMLPENDMDKRRAGIVDFGLKGEDGAKIALKRGLYDGRRVAPRSLLDRVQRDIRAATDPFAVQEEAGRRKRAADNQREVNAAEDADAETPVSSQQDRQVAEVPSQNLVDYDSD